MHLCPAHLSQSANVFTQHAARSSIHLPGAARPHWGPPSSLRPVLSSGRWSKLSQQLSETAHFHFPFCCWALSDLPERPLHLSLGKMAQAENHSINSSITADGDVLLCIYLQSIYRGCCPILFSGVKKTFCTSSFFFFFQWLLGCCYVSFPRSLQPNYCFSLHLVWRSEANADRWAARGVCPPEPEPVVLSITDNCINNKETWAI